MWCRGPGTGRHPGFPDQSDPRFTGLHVGTRNGRLGIRRCGLDEPQWSRIGRSCQARQATWAGRDRTHRVLANGCVWVAAVRNAFDRICRSAIARARRRNAAPAGGAAGEVRERVFEASTADRGNSTLMLDSTIGQTTTAKAAGIRMASRIAVSGAARNRSQGPIPSAGRMALNQPCPAPRAAPSRSGNRMRWNGGSGLAETRHHREGETAHAPASERGIPGVEQQGSGHRACLKPWSSPSPGCRKPSGMP